MKNLISHCHLFSHLFNSRYQGNYRFSFISEPPYSHGQLSETRKKFKPIFITLLAAMLPLFPRCRWSVLVSRKRLAVEFGSIERGSFGIHQLDVVPPGPQVMDKSCKHWTFTRKKGKLCQSETFQLRVLMGVCVWGGFCGLECVQFQLIDAQTLSTAEKFKFVQLFSTAAIRPVQWASCSRHPIKPLW